MRREALTSILVSNPRVDGVALNVDGAVTPGPAAGGRPARAAIAGNTFVVVGPGQRWREASSLFGGDEA
ncbi:hypothetical protein M1N47_00260 [Dehalococcoidia bacterium]|nr:hypothetical protein [Dehalococcoidia bacterium]